LSGILSSGRTAAVETTIHRCENNLHVMNFFLSSVQLFLPLQYFDATAAAAAAEVVVVVVVVVVISFINATINRLDTSIVAV